MTSQEMDMMTQYFYEQDYSNCSDWSVLFSTSLDFTNAVLDKNNPMHEQAKTIYMNISGGNQEPDKVKLNPDWYKAVDDNFLNNPNK